MADAFHATIVQSFALHQQITCFCCKNILCNWTILSLPEQSLFPISNSVCASRKSVYVVLVQLAGRQKGRQGFTAPSSTPSSPQLRLCLTTFICPTAYTLVHFYSWHKAERPGKISRNDRDSGTFCLSPQLVSLCASLSFQPLLPSFAWRSFCNACPTMRKKTFHSKRERR